MKWIKKLSKLKANETAESFDMDAPAGSEEVFNLEKDGLEANLGALDNGMVTARDLISPPSFYLGEAKEGDWMKVGRTFVRPFVMMGYPSAVSVGWLDHIYNHDGDMDVALHIEPADDREALDELSLIHI